MFRWFRDAQDTLAEVDTAFAGMLDDGRRVFDLAMSVRLGGADPTTVEEDLLRTEERTDEAERRIRRLLLTRVSVHGSADLSACLLYMSVAKDAERVADLSKNLFGIGRTVGAPPASALRDDFIRLRDEVSPMITEAARIFREEDTETAHTFIEEAREIQRYCTGRIDELLLERIDVVQPAATVLTYRQFARILANLINIVSAVVVPLDQIDYPNAEGEVS